MQGVTLRLASTRVRTVAAQTLDVFGAGVPIVDQDVAAQFGNLRAAHLHRVQETKSSGLPVFLFAATPVVTRGGVAPE